MSDFKKEYLGSGIIALVSPEHTFGTDAVLLADFAAPGKKSKCCDLGSGCGIIPLLWCKKKTGEITAVEIQEQGYNQIKAAVELNKLEGRLVPVNADLKALKGILPFGHFDIVTMNPPYTADGAGIKSASGADIIARHGTLCTFADICFAASKLLNFGGKLCMCIRPERLCELFSEMKKVSIEPKRMRFVSKTDGKAPWLALVEGRLGGKSGMTVIPELHVYSSAGEYSDEMKQIYSDYLLENRGDDN
ncbi:MAG: methyltransferase [Clostridia bacterium]|nr:methyltransferase [Clostridia bacterium]